MEERKIRQNFLQEQLPCIPGMIPALTGQLILYFWHEKDVIMFAETFLKYWLKSGSLLFNLDSPEDETEEAYIKRFHDLVVKKYGHWKVFMEYKELDDAYAEFI